MAFGGSQYVALLSSLDPTPDVRTQSAIVTSSAASFSRDAPSAKAGAAAAAAAAAAACFSLGVGAAATWQVALNVSHLWFRGHGSTPPVSVALLTVKLHSFFPMHSASSASRAATEALQVSFDRNGNEPPPPPPHSPDGSPKSTNSNPVIITAPPQETVAVEPSGSLALHVPVFPPPPNCDKQRQGWQGWQGEHVNGSPV